jgi:hypothetical protein
VSVRMSTSSVGRPWRTACSRPAKYRSTFHAGHRAKRTGSDKPVSLLDGLSPTIGWYFPRQADGSPVSVILHRSALGSLKVVESFPLVLGAVEAGFKSPELKAPQAYAAMCRQTISRHVWTFDKRPSVDERG